MYRSVEAMQEEQESIVKVLVLLNALVQLLGITCTFTEKRCL